MPHRFAFLETSPGTVVLGRGPFEKSPDRPTGNDQTAFYIDNFAGSSLTPWWVPASVEVLTPDDIWPFKPGPKIAQPSWEEAPDLDAFTPVFDEVARTIREGRAEKMVPVLPHRATWPNLENHLLSALEQSREWQWRYALVGDEQGAGHCGVTPELLFRIDGDLLETMAVAGTTRRDDEQAFIEDAKEIREHELVVSFLESTLAAFGEVEREPRGLIRVGGVTHFRSPISVRLHTQPDITELIRALHPTPAVGCLPRDAALSDQLLELRDRVGCPDQFGAPMGLLHDGQFHAVIAIRGMFWRGDEVILPTGCGLIEESRLEDEIAEHELKRQAVRRIFGLKG